MDGRRANSSQNDFEFSWRNNRGATFCLISRVLHVVGRRIAGCFTGTREFDWRTTQLVWLRFTLLLLVFFDVSISVYFHRICTLFPLPLACHKNVNWSLYTRLPRVSKSTRCYCHRTNGRKTLFTRVLARNNK